MTPTAGRNDITSKSMDQTLVARLYTPEGFDPAGGYPAVVMSPPFNQVKEQTMAAYDPRLAARGYVALAVVERDRLFGLDTPPLNCKGHDQ